MTLNECLDIVIQNSKDCDWSIVERMIKVLEDGNKKRFAQDDIIWDSLTSGWITDNGNVIFKPIKKEELDGQN